MEVDRRPRCQQNSSQRVVSNSCLVQPQQNIRIEFVNDQNVNGVDRNVQIFEYRVVDGDTGFVSTASTSDSNVLNSGVFEPGSGLVERFGAGGFLAGDVNGNNAFVQNCLV